MPGESIGGMRREIAAANEMTMDGSGQSSGPAGVSWWIWGAIVAGVLVILFLFLKKPASTAETPIVFANDDQGNYLPPINIIAGGGGTSSGSSSSTSTGSTSTQTKTTTPQAKYMTVGKWPGPNSDLSMIATSSHTTLAQIEALNPWIYQQRHSWNLIYPNEQIRVQ